MFLHFGTTESLTTSGSDSGEQANIGEPAGSNNRFGVTLPLVAFSGRPNGILFRLTCGLTGSHSTLPILTTCCIPVGFKRPPEPFGNQGFVSLARLRGIVLPEVVKLAEQPDLRLSGRLVE